MALYAKQVVVVASLQVTKMGIRKGEMVRVWILMMLIVFVEGCWDQEKAALLHFKAQNWCTPDYTESWSAQSDCCQEWDRVGCGPDGHITSLDLFACRDFMTYDPRPFDASVLLPLQQLRELDLSGNQITGWTQITKVAAGSANLSSSTLSFKNLQVLDLNDNSLLSNGSILLPQGFEFPSLKTLLLESNYVHSQLLVDIPEGFKNLEKLDLKDNAIRNFTILSGGHQLRKLKILDLSYNGLETIPSCLGGIKSLEELHLYNNRFVGEIPLSFQNLKNLRILDLSENHFSGNIPSWMGSWTKLRELNLGSNNFKGVVTSSPFKSLLSLEILDLSNNNFRIPHSFKPFANLSKLTHFQGDSNQVFVDEPAVEDALMPTFQLQELILSNCSLVKFPSFLQHQHNLSYIDLSSNSLREDFPTWLLENNPQLDTLILNNNFLTGALNLTSYPHDLRDLDISQNDIRHIPAEFGVVFSQLQDFSMSNNHVKGNVLRSISKIKSLKYLDVSHNKLSRGLSHLTRGCVNLSTLDLSHNQFEGELPSFYNLTWLSTVNFEGNYFSGRIPNNLFLPGFVSILILGKNQLEGPIPQDLCQLHQFGTFDLSYNKLSGSVSSCLCNLTAWQVHLNNNYLNYDVSWPLNNPYTTLDLSYNELRGQILSLFGPLFQVQDLVLKGNKIDGHLPITLCNLAGLDILDLSDNNLSGTIPLCLGQHHFRHRIPTTFVMLRLLHDTGGIDSLNFTTKNHSYQYDGDLLSFMSGIDLSNNNLIGKIPPHLGNLSYLQALNLSHNKLWGGIPASFSNLTAIESLDLSHNSLDGSIPPQLAQLNSLGFFSVAYNNLSGRIPFEAHLMTFDASSYQGNLLLCGLPLSKSCTPDDNTTNVNKKKVEDDNEWIDMETFYVSFTVTSVTMFLAVVVILWINPYWGSVLFLLAETCIFSSLYFIQDAIRKLTRVRSV